MKQRFSSLDVKVIAHELSNALLTLRVSNIYDLSSKIFLIKFAKPDNKQQIIIDSGFRCHLTEFSRATAAAPSNFVTRLRKYLKTRRVTSISQVGTDRIIEFQFSDGQYKLFLEFYAGGNIILTDRELNILALLREVSEGEAQERLRVGLQYSLENRQNYGGIPPLTKERLKDALKKGLDKGEEGLVAGKKSKKKAADALRKTLAVSITEFPPMLVDHSMRMTGFDSSLKPAEVLDDDGLLEHLMRSLQEAQRVIQEITGSKVAKGYIIAKKREGEHEDSRKCLIYDDFHPFRPRQFEDDPTSVFLEYEGFNKTVDEFFSSIEGQKLESKLQERETTAKRKIEAARQDQANRLGGLQEVQELNVRKAGALTANVERVQEAMDAVNGLIAQGMDWVEMGKLIELEQKRKNAVASIIKLPLKLHENTVTLLLSEEVDADDDSAYGSETDSDVSDSEDIPEPKGKMPEELTIDVNLALSPWANATEYYDYKKAAAIKEEKTLEQSTKALKNQEAKIAQDLKKGLKQEKAILRPVRKQMWFEKFSWFISSDKYLVLGGKDAQQNEILYKKYLRKGDVYVHADLHGAASIVIRNNPKTPDAPIPPSTLSQAGTMAVASSTAWDSKAGMSAWWVNADQVSKSAPTGEFLPTGSFMIRGKKNFLPPAQLILGFGVMFHISEESKARHVKHRIYDEKETEAHDSVGEQTHNLVDDDDDEQSADGEDNILDVEDEKEPANPLQSQQAKPEESTVEDEPTIEDEPTVEDEPPIQEVKDMKLDSDPQSESDSDSLIPTTGTQTPSQKVNKGPTPPKRGKRGKAKKIASKYKHQDAEDRLAAQALIGATAGLEKLSQQAELKAAREAELAFQKERRRAQHLRSQREMKEHEEVRKAMLRDGGGEGLGLGSDDAEEERMTSLDGLVGTPLPGDEILDAIPMCAPWAAMGKCKYKAKLQPGTTKKGKAVKEILGRWVGEVDMRWVDEKGVDGERMWPREVELLRGWKTEEVTNTVWVRCVRVMMAGGSRGGSAGGNGSGSAGRGKGGGRGGKGSKKR